MPNIKLKNEIGVDQIYTNITKIKLPLEDGTYKGFSETGLTTITSSFSDQVILDGTYMGDPLTITSNGTVNLDLSIALDKKIPLGLDIQIKEGPEGTIDITNTELTDVSNYATARIVAPNLYPENIKKGVTILGVTGEAVGLNRNSSAYTRSLVAWLENKKSLYRVLKNSNFPDYSFISVADLSTFSSVYEMLSGSNIQEVYLPNLSAATDFDAICMGCTDLTKVTKLDTPSATSMKNAFKNCTNLISINTGLNLAKVTRCESLFQNCESLEKIPPLDLSSLSSYISSSSTVNTRLFENCKSLKTVKITNLAPNTSMSYWFNNCTSLEEVELPCLPNAFFRTSSEVSSIFSNCYSLKCITFTQLEPKSFSYLNFLLNSCYHFTGQTNSTYNPKGLRDGIIRVPADMVSTLKSLGGWSTYADQIYAIGEEVKTETMSIIGHLGKQSVDHIISLSTFNFTEIPTVQIISEDKRIVNITKIKVSKSRISFTANFPGTAGKTNIKILVSNNSTLVYSEALPVQYFDEYLSPMWQVLPVEGASYGFTLNTDGYYESTNQNKNNSYSLCKVIFTNLAEVVLPITLDCINWAESCCDFGILSNLDTTLSLSSNADSTNVYKSFSGQSSNAVQQVTYSIPPGEHFIYIKYKKDGSVNNNNDSFKFKIIN